MRIKLKEVRERKGYTVRKLSELSGVSIAQISRIENGISNPTALVLCQLAKALEVPITDLIVCIE